MKMVVIVKDTEVVQLEALDTEKAMGPDSILAIVLKAYAPELAAPITKLFQSSYKSSIYLTMWKFDQVSFVHNEQEKSIPANSQTNSLLSIISKVMESIQMQQDLDDIQACTDK
eukprot:g20236.t1